MAGLNSRLIYAFVATPVILFFNQRLTLPLFDGFRELTSKTDVSGLYAKVNPMAA